MSAESVPPIAGEQAPARYRLVGTTTEQDTCQCCGRTDLKRVVVLHDGDDDGFFGAQCAARLLPTPVGDLTREATTAQRQADQAAAVAAGFGADLEGSTPSSPRACVRFHKDHAAFDRYLAAGREPQQH